MELNDIKPAPGAKKNPRRVGRGIGSGLGKTAGRGHKGQRARSGGFHKVGFEGGQMPLHRRLPKRGFHSLTRGDVVEVRIGRLEVMKATDIDLAALKAEGVVSQQTLAAKVILAGKLSRKITLKEVKATKGARAMIEAAGGRYEYTEPVVVEKPKKEKKAKKAAKPEAEEAPKGEAAKS